jgi:hypothetical protein
VGASNGPTQRLGVDRLRAVRRPNATQAGLYVSRSTAGPAAAPVNRGATGGSRVDRLRELAREGRLAAGTAGEERLALTAAAYDLAWPIVYARLTRRFEQRRGHLACAAGVDHLADDCLNRFRDDVEAVVDDLFAHARQPVLELEAWIADRLSAATANGQPGPRGRRDVIGDRTG